MLTDLYKIAEQKLKKPLRKARRKNGAIYSTKLSSTRGDSLTD